MSSLLMAFLTIEIALTLLLAALYVYDKRLEFDENDTLILDSAEEHLVTGQAELRLKVRKVESWLKYTGIGWLVLGVFTFGLYVAEGIGLV